MAVYFLGPLCRRGHEHEGTGQTLRRANGRPTGICPKCATANKYRYLHRKKRGQRYEADTYWGNPCLYGHTVNGQTLRYCSTLTCVECQRGYSLRYNAQLINAPILGDRPAP